MKTEKNFTINGIIEITEGDYLGKHFVINKINKSPHTKIPNFISFECSSLNGNISNFKFDNHCSIQIGILTILKRNYG